MCAPLPTLHLRDVFRCHFFFFRVRYLLWPSATVFRSRRDLSARDCLFLAQHAFARGYYDKALQWAQTSLTRADDTPVGTVDDAEEIEKLRRDVHSFVQHASRVVSPSISPPPSLSDTFGRWPHLFANSTWLDEEIVGHLLRSAVWTCPVQE